jgi:hypothetical protein
VRRRSPAMCGLCQRGVARGAYTRSDSQGAYRRRQACLAFLDQLRPRGRSTLSTTTTETLADSPLGSDWRMVQLLNVGRTVLGPSYCQRALRSSPGPAPAKPAGAAQETLDTPASTTVALSQEAVCCDHRQNPPTAQRTRRAVPAEETSTSIGIWLVNCASSSLPAVSQQPASDRRRRDETSTRPSAC